MKELKEEIKLLNKIITCGAIIIIILLFALLSTSYEEGVQKCINSGHEENYCRVELSK